MNLLSFRVDFLLEDMRAGEAPDFWTYVDSQPNYYARPTDESWVNERGSWCLAANAQGDRCAKNSQGHPFCSFHLPRVREWMEAAERHHNVRRALTRHMLTADEASSVIRQARELLWAAPDDRVYFWELEGQGLVKIGHSRRVALRTQQFRNGKGCTFPPGVDPSTGHLLGTVGGGAPMEKHLHSAHRRLRVIGEWFRLTEELADDIADLIARESAEQAA